MNATAQYSEFHGRRPRRVSPLNVHIPKSLVYLGEAVAIEYRCDKINGGGDGKTAVYRHEFETPALVCMDERASKQLYIIGPRIKITDRGIIN